MRKKPGRMGFLNLFLTVVLILVLGISYQEEVKDAVKSILPWGGKRGEMIWQQVPLVSEENQKAGVKQGGEGGQWPHTLEVSMADSNLIFYGTNTGGIYRSDDGGASWALCTRGIYSRGGNAFAIDPCNDQYVLVAGSGDAPGDCHGIYASSDRGLTWMRVLALPISGNKVYLDGLEYDPSSFDEKEGRCMTAYYSAPYETERESGLNEREKGLYRSLDGGGTWELVNYEMSDAKLFVEPATGVLFAAREDGLYVSEDGGGHFSCIYSGELTGCDISWENETIYLCDHEKIFKGSRKGGFRPVAARNLPQGGSVGRIAVSPVNPQYLLIQSEEESNQYGTIDQIYSSKDGGETWKLWNYDESKDFIPYDTFEKVFAWSYEDENTVWSFGGEYVIASKDGGENWVWSSDGICGILCGGKFHFNIFDPDLMYFGAQDLNGAITTDGGETWRYVDMSRKGNHGHVYGGYAASSQVFWGCLAEGWEEPKYITITFDGGKSFTDTGYAVDEDIPNRDLSSYQSYNCPEIFFAGNYRSADGGRTWREMENCLQVYTHNPEGSHELYGCERDGGYVLVSYDEGESWERVNREEIPLTDRKCLSEIQVDPEAGKIYVAANGKELYVVDMENGDVENLTEFLPADHLGNVRVNGIAVDSENGRIYVAGNSSGNLRDYTVVCSEDRGRTWYDATPAGEKYGGVEVNSARCIRMRPGSNEIWCSTGCFGFVKLGIKKEE